MGFNSGFKGLTVGLI